VTTPPRAAVRRLALGRVISSAGTFAAGTALNFAIYRETHSTAWLAATMLLTWGLTGFFAPLAGAIGDRFDRRAVMIWTESLAALGWIAISMIADAPALLLGVAFVASLAETPYFPASGAAIPNVAGVDNLSWANSLLAAGNYLGISLGPLIGGLLVATVGARWVFVANAASYLVSAALTASVHADFADRASRTEDAEAEHAGLVAGFRFVFRDRVLRLLVVAWSAAMLGLAMALIADPALAEAFDVGAFGYGMIGAAWGGGTILGAWLGRNLRESNEGWWLVACTALLGVAELGIALAPFFWVVLVWSVVFGLADGPTQVAEQNLLQRRTPDVVRSRVMGAWEAMFHAALTGALVLGAVVVPVLGPKGAYALGGVAGFIGAAMLLPLLRWLPEAGGAPADAVEVVETA
jgi:MFS family permease